MFSKVALFIAAALALSAVASPIDVPTDIAATPSDDGKCSSTVQCCGSLQAPTSEEAAKQLTLVGVLVQDVTGQVGLECNPITGIGAGTGANCASSPVCCEKNFSNQLLGINCTPVTVGA